MAAGWIDLQSSRLLPRADVFLFDSLDIPRHL